MFMTVLQKVQAAILNGIKITKDTKLKQAGIYMLYVDNFSDERVIPFYIGQTTDIQKRFKDHLTALIAINRFSQDSIRRSVLTGPYNGHFKTCKIFKYMVDHQCTLHDFHAVVLEFVDDTALLAEREHAYFSEYLPAFFGFNQLNSLTFYATIRNDICEKNVEQYYNYLIEDAKHIDKYYNFGFTTFNYKYSFISELAYTELAAPDLQEILLAGIKYLENKYVSSEDRFKEQRIDRLQIEAKANYSEYDALIKERDALFFQRFNEIMDRYKIKNKIQSENLHNALVKNDETSLFRFNKYLNTRLISDDLYGAMLPIMPRCREINEVAKKFGNLYTVQSAEAREIRTGVRYEQLSMLLPEREYTSYSLQDAYSPRPFKIHTEYNECEIHFFVSNAGRNRQPELLKIDYCIDLNDHYFEQRDLYVLNETTTFGESEGEYYIEKDEVECSGFAFNPFTPIPIQNNQYSYEPTMITPSAEYNSGINEYTCRGKTKYALKDILKDIEEHINEDTRFAVYTSESLSSLERALGKLADDVMMRRILYDIRRKNRRPSK